MFFTRAFNKKLRGKQSITGKPMTGTVFKSPYDHDGSLAEHDLVDAAPSWVQFIDQILPEPLEPVALT